MQPHAPVCPQCRNPLNEGALYCPVCGFPIPPPQPRLPLYRRPGTMMIMILFVVAVFVMIPLVILAVRELRSPLARLGKTSAEIEDPAPAESTAVASSSMLKGVGRVYLVPVGEVKTVSLPKLVDHFQAQFGLSIQVLPAVPLEAGVDHAERKQVIAEELIARMKRAQPALADDPQAILIGITDRDMYIWHFPWKYALSLRQNNRFAVVSTARMDPAFERQATDRLWLEARVRRMVTKNLGLMYYGLEESEDWESALYDGIGEPADLDEMRDAFTIEEVRETERRVHPAKGRLVYESTGDPCWNFVNFLRKSGRASHWQWIDSCNSITPQTTGAEAYSVDLRYGILFTRRTDVMFSEPDTLPIRFTRVCRNQDPVQRPFGMGCNHTYGAYLWSSGSLMGDVKLVLEDSSVAYRRTTPPLFFWPTEYVQTGWGGDFSSSRIEEKWPYRGWVLTQLGGTTYTFSDEGRLESIRDYQGNQILLELSPGKKHVTHIQSLPVTHGVLLDLDGAGRILRATGDGGRNLDYAYDERGRLVRVRSSEGQLTYAYDGNGNLLAVRDENDQTVLANKYDRKNRVIEQTLADGRVYRFRYIEDSHGNVAGADVVDEQGRAISVFFGNDNFRIYATE